MKPQADDADNVSDEDQDLIAYLDGELDKRKTREVEAKLARDPKSREKMQSYKKTWDLLDNLPKVEPSRSFTERTIEKIEPLPVQTVSRTAPALSAVHPSTMVPVAVPPKRWKSAWLFTVAAMLIGVGGGYLGKAWIATRNKPAAPDYRERDGQIVREMRLLKDLDFYQYVDDMEFLKELATPEYIGE